MDTFETCSKWAREGYCTTSSKVMMLHCRESCGTCGFKSGKKLHHKNIFELIRIMDKISSKIKIISVFNREPQYNRIGSKQYTDLDSPEFRKQF